jgi:thioesterase domain-containing protein
MLVSQSISAPQALVELRSGGSRRPLVCFHAVDGKLSVYRRLLKQLPDDLRVYGLQAEERPEMEQSLSELAARYCDELMSSDIEQPYRFMGFSFGAMVAMHVAAEVESRGGAVEFVGIVDYRPIHFRDQQAVCDCLANYLTAVFQQYGQASTMLRSLSADELTRAASELASYLLGDERLPSTEDGVIAMQRAGLIDPTVRVELIADFFRPMFARLGWLKNSNLRPIEAPLLVWRAAEGFGGGRVEWSAWTTAAREESPLPGNHLTAMQSQSVKRLGAELSGWLVALDAAASVESSQTDLALTA